MYSSFLQQQDASQIAEMKRYSNGEILILLNPALGKHPHGEIHVSSTVAVTKLSNLFIHFLFSG